MINRLICLILIVCSFAVQAQERAAIKGRVYTGVVGISDMLVVNFSAQTETRTDSLGYFTIKARVGDLFILSDHRIETRKIRYTPDLLKKGIVQLEVIMTATEIEEISITRSKITSQSLGIPMGKAYTPEQRRLRAGSSDPLGYVINVLSGRLKMLKANAKTEKKVFALQSLDDSFDENFYLEELKLEKEQIGGFKYYAIEDEALRYELINGTIGTIKFKLAELAIKYKKANAE